VATCCPSVAHQTALDLAPAAPLSVTLEPPAVQLHVWQPGRAQFVTHTAPIPVGADFERFVLQA
jgi:hypothetical protein